MRKLRLIPAKTNIPFIGLSRAALAFSGLLIAASIILVIISGLNFGIDFRGGTLIEVRTPQPANISEMRDELGQLGLGDISLQEFGADTDVLIRIQQQEGDEQAQAQAVDLVQETLGPEVDYRRVEFVGPQVGEELKRQGAMALGLAMLGILAYIWLRFEWQFSICAILALAHDVIATIGMYALTQIDFNLSTVAAVLTIIGYSINDTVIVFDRIRENMRRYKTMPIPDLLNLSINDTLSRTTMTSMTTLLALLALYIFGGEVIRSFTFAMIWGVVIGTYSSIFVAAPLLIWFRLRPEAEKGEEAEASAAP